MKRVNFNASSGSETSQESFGLDESRNPVMTIKKYLDKSHPKMDTLQRGMFERKHRAKFLTEKEWSNLVDPELTKRIV